MVRIQERKERRRKRLKRRILIFFTVIAIAVISGTAYTYFEYQAGQQAAEEEMADAQNEEQSEQYKEEFQGDNTEDSITNVLLIGKDSSGGKSENTDTIMIGQYDPEEESAKLVSVMRDMYVEIPGHSNNKINAAFALGGPELLRQTIKENFDVDIDYYAMVNFDGFEGIVNTIAPDGLTIDVEKDMQYESGDGLVDIDLQEGVQDLTGEEVLEYARFRADNENDFGRVRRQQQVMSVLKDQMMSFTGVSKLPRAVGTLEPYVDTNMDTGKMISTMTSYLRNTPGEIETLRIPVEGSYSNERYSHAGLALEVDFAENTRELNDFLGQVDDQVETVKNEDDEEIHDDEAS
ncbi:LCP family protein [Alkalibacillus salilacus]|uniref:Regulatory protein MsrR n=1 Tax=Alkalibacillus salilacus TaxID=284582 RepID=A0ABT9VHU0_9BACI|nr:LCP family protein [Alkalibacillus salilacus]MDQ0160523.1 LCP family protein required for cell wall assembly [Alkalibacillus salilacus]